MQRRRGLPVPNPLGRGRSGAIEDRLPRDAHPGSRGPAGAVAGHGDRPRFQRALRGCSPGDRRILHAVRRCQRRPPGARTARREPGQDLLRGVDRPRGRCHGRRSAGRRGPRERDRGRGGLGPSPLRGPRHRRTGWPVQLAVPEHAHDVRPVGGGNARRRGCHGPSPAPGQYGAGAARTLHLAVRAGQPGGNGRESSARGAGRDRVRLRGRIPRRRGLAENGRHQLPPGGVLRLLRRDDGGDQHAGLPRDARRPGGRDGDRALVVAGDRNRDGPSRPLSMCRARSSAR